MIVLDFIRNYDTKKSMRYGIPAVEVLPDKFKSVWKIDSLASHLKNCFLGIESEIITIHSVGSVIVLGVKRKIGAILFKTQITVFDIEEIKDQDISYLILKYGKILLEDVDNV